MRILKQHLPVLLLFGAVVVVAFGRTVATPLWNVIDRDIIHEAGLLAQNPWEMFQRPGVIFSQPVLLLAFLGEYLLFGLNGAGYLAVNLLVHTINAFLIYLLVHMLFYEKKIAVLAGLLTALCVGNYGKVLMSVAHLEPLLLTTLHLTVLYFLIRNEFKHGGRLRSIYFVIGLGIFLVSGLTRASAFSLLGCLLAFKFFFYRHEGWRRIFTPNLAVLIGIGLLFFVGRNLWLARVGSEVAGEDIHYSWISFKNIFRYVNLMFFPLQTSEMLDGANPLVHFIFGMRTPVRLFISLSVISYSFFGFVFGNKALRFFIAWFYITLAPFTYVTESGGWLNLQHLYLASFSFAVILVVVARAVGNLLRRHRWRRQLPFVLPLFYAILSLTFAHLMNEQNLRRDPIDLSAPTPREVSGVYRSGIYL